MLKKTSADYYLFFNFVLTMCKIFDIMNITKQHKQMQLFAKCNFLRGDEL